MNLQATIPNRQTEGRNYGIDFLRILCMFMVCVLHVLSYGNFFDFFSDHPGVYWANQAINTLSFSCVNCYILISGYFGMRSKKHAWSRLIELWICVLFYSVVLGVVSFATGKEVLGPLNLIRMFLPLTTDRYWFFSAYVVAFLVGPFICKGVEVASPKVLKTFIAIFLVLFSLLRFPSLIFATDSFLLNAGRSPLWLCFVFFIGAYLNKCPIRWLEKRKGISFLLFLASAGIMLTETFLIDKVSIAIGWGSFSLFITNNTAIWVLLGAVFLFYTFLNMRIAPFFQKIIKLFAPCAFGAYLIHMHPYGLHFLRGIGPKLAEWVPMAAIPLAAVLAALAVFAICILLDLVRFWLFRLIRVDKACKAIGKKVSHLADGN